jgi:hypothetical protein
MTPMLVVLLALVLAGIVWLIETRAETHRKDDIKKALAELEKDDSNG